MDTTSEADMLTAARGGDRKALESLVAPHVPMLRSVVQRMVMHPQDAEDLVQDTLVRAMERISGFRGDGSIRAWLLSIGTRKAIDFLRSKRRWGIDAQKIGAAEAAASPDVLDAISDAASAGEFVYEFRQHVSYCFSCVSRSLPPEVAAVLLLRDVFDCTTRETAQITGLSQSVVRHRVSQARTQMGEAFDDMCSLVSKNGYCHQCAALRDALPSDRRGRPPVPLHDVAPRGDEPDAPASYRLRLPVVRAYDHSRSSPLHDYVRRFMAERFD